MTLSGIPFYVTAVMAWLAANSGPCAPVEILSRTSPQPVFSGPGKNIAVTLRNPHDQNFQDKLQARVFQTTSATAVLLAQFPWKRVLVPAHETVLESARLAFPSVTAATKFIVQWLVNSNQIVGETEVMVYPTNLLEELKPLAVGQALGVFDPWDRLKPLLKDSGIDFIDLGAADLEDFQGKLAVIGPFLSLAEMREGLPERIQALTKRNIAVLWIRPPPATPGRIWPSFYTASEKQRAAVIVQPDMVEGLNDNPQAQLNLVFFCKLAMSPRPLALPGVPPANN